MYASWSIAISYVGIDTYFFFPPPPPADPLSAPELVPFPASQPAMSKFCSCDAAPPEPLIGPFFCISSNSCFISGSTVELRQHYSSSPEGGRLGVLLSIRYGIPKMNATDTSPMSIIGLFTKPQQVKASSWLIEVLPTARLYPHI